MVKSEHEEGHILGRTAHHAETGDLNGVLNSRFILQWCQHMLQQRLGAGSGGAFGQLCHPENDALVFIGQKG